MPKTVNIYLASCPPACVTLFWGFVFRGKNIPQIRPPPLSVMLWFGVCVCVCVCEGEEGEGGGGGGPALDGREMVKN